MLLDTLHILRVKAKLAYIHFFAFILNEMKVFYVVVNIRYLLPHNTKIFLNYMK